MLIKFWGVRGSIPVSGREYLKYGGMTTCVEITASSGETIIIDSGTGIRKLGLKLLKEKKKVLNMFFTHAHWDHIMGFPFFKPIYLEEVKINMYGCPFSQVSIEMLISGAMEQPHFPVNFKDIKAVINSNKSCNSKFNIGNVEITPVVLSHPNQGIGYKFCENGKSFIFLTDNELSHTHVGGLAFSDYVKFCKGADLLVHDAEFTLEEYKYTKGWGYSTFNDTVKLALEAGAKELILWHHNQEHTDEDMDKIVRDSKNIIKNYGAYLVCSAAFEGMEIKL